MKYSLALKVTLSVFSCACLNLSDGASFVKIGSSTYYDRVIFDSVAVEDFAQVGASPQFYHNSKTTIYNPILDAKNIYAPDIYVQNSKIYCYYGGMLNSGDTDDRIYLSRSDDMEPVGSWYSPELIINKGSFDGVNDPNVVKYNNTFYMVYTVVDVVNQVNNERDDKIAWATSSDGQFWSPSAPDSSDLINLTVPSSILSQVPGNSLTDWAVPALVNDDGAWIMFFTGRMDHEQDHSYTFRAIDPGGNPDDFTVTHYLGKPAEIGYWPLLLECDVHVEDDGSYLAVFRVDNELWIAKSTDKGETWDPSTYHKQLDPDWAYDHPLGSSGGFTNPGFFYNHQVGRMQGLAFGTFSPTFFNQDVGFSYNQYVLQARSNGSVWHSFGNSGLSWQLHLYSHGYSTFDQFRIINPVNGHIIYTQNVSARVGEVWKYYP